MRVFVGFAQDFTIDIGPEAWWNQRVPAVLLIEDNNDGVLWSQQYLFGDGQFDDDGSSAAIGWSDHEFYDIHGNGDASWSPWKEWARWYGVVFAVFTLALAASLLWAARHVFIRRRQLWAALTSAASKPE